MAVADEQGPRPWRCALKWRWHELDPGPGCETRGHHECAIYTNNPGHKSHRCMCGAAAETAAPCGPCAHQSHDLCLRACAAYDRPLDPDPCGCLICYPMVMLDG